MAQLNRSNFIMFKKEPLNLVFCAKKVNKFTSALPGFDDGKNTSWLVNKSGVRRRKRARGRRLRGRVFALRPLSTSLHDGNPKKCPSQHSFLGPKTQKTRSDRFFFHFSARFSQKMLQKNTTRRGVGRVFL